VGFPVKVVILAGGRGTRIAEESHLRPKPMIEIGGRPILWHIMKMYAQHGLSDFVICLGYRGYMIKEYFANYVLHSSDVTVDMSKNQITFHNQRSEDWRVTLVDTGENTLTGGRVKRVGSYLNNETFCLTYGDGVADVDISAELEAHKKRGLLATMTIVRPPARYGSSVTDGDRVVAFEEKPQASSGLINGGFFVIEPAVLELIAGDDTPFESEPLQRLADMGQLGAWEHSGFWQAMDTLREKELLEELWAKGQAPWKTW
jgi:glucose-1-phosphate cytidylyltransferase